MDDAPSLIETLALERIEVNLFRGTAPVGQGPRIFGGHVIAQALMAAYKTVEDRICHSLHCYFIRPGDPSVPILYEVDRARDGKSFTTRRVTAIQHGEQIFNLASSFQVPETGFEHQDSMPDVPGPDSLTADAGTARWIPHVEMRRTRPDDFKESTPGPAFQNNWMRARAPLGDDIVINQVVLAYASDMSFLGTAMLPHGMNGQSKNNQVASLDHAMWFHRQVRFNDWHLFAQHSPSAAGARGFNLGAIYDIDGRLVASMAQEGLIRHRQAAP
jgi:acyl-CoA thioesterase-2